MMMHCMERDVSSQSVQSPSRNLISKARGLDFFMWMKQAERHAFKFCYVICYKLSFDVFM